MLGSIIALVLIGFVCTFVYCQILTDVTTPERFDIEDDEPIHLERYMFDRYNRHLY